MNTDSAKAERKNDMRTVLSLLSFLKTYKRLVASAIIFGIVSMAMELAPPILWKYGIDVGIIKQEWTVVPTVVVALVVVQLLDAVTTALRKGVIDRLTAYFGESLRRAVFHAFLRLSHEQTAKQHGGEITHVYTSDIELLQKALIDGADTYITNIVRLIGVVCIFCWLQPALGAATLLPVAGVGALLFTYNGAIRSFYRTARKSYGKLTRYVNDVIHGSEVVRAFGQQAQVSEAHDRLNTDYMEIAVAAGERRAFFKPFVRGIAGFGKRHSLRVRRVPRVSGAIDGGRLNRVPWVLALYVRPLGRSRVCGRSVATGYASGKPSNGTNRRGAIIRS